MIFISILFILIGQQFPLQPAWRFSDITPHSSDVCYMDLASWDYNKDGSVALAVASYQFNPSQPQVSSSRVFLLERDEYGEVVKTWEGNPPDSGHHPGYFALLWADVNGNGYEDLIAGSVSLAGDDAYLIAYI